MAKLNILKMSHLAPLRTHEAGPATESRRDG
jgi:hypothetical protein